jgi:hypothetical protein
MIEQLRRALEHSDELPPALRDEIAEQIEAYTEPVSLSAGSLAGSMPDLPDDAEETLLRWRWEVPPTPPLDEQLRWLDEE